MVRGHGHEQVTLGEVVSPSTPVLAGVGERWLISRQPQAEQVSPVPQFPQARKWGGIWLLGLPKASKSQHSTWSPPSPNQMPAQHPIQRSLPHYLPAFLPVPLPQWWV